jgi:hypothetical protein
MSAITRRGRQFQRPSRKWWAAQIAATTTLGTGWVSAGAWTKPLSLMAIGIVSQATITYLVPNAEQAPRAESRPAPEPAQRATAVPAVAAIG